MRKFSFSLFALPFILGVLLGQAPLTVWRLPRGDEQGSGFASLPLQPPLCSLWYFLPETPTQGSRFNMTHNGRRAYLVSATTIAFLDLATGQIIREEQLPVMITTVPVVIRDKVFVGTSQGEILSFDAETGVRGEAVELGRVAINGLGAYHDFLLVGTSDGYLFAIHSRDLTGELSGIRLGEAVATDILVGQGKGIAFACVGTVSQRLFFLRLQGGDKSLSFRPYSRLLLPPGASLTLPVYDPKTDSVFVGVGQRLLQFRARRGLLTRRVRLRGAIKAPPALTPDGLLIVGTDQGLLYALSIRDLRLRWRRALGAPIRSAPLVTKDWVWTATIDGILFGLDLKTGRVHWRYRLADIDPNLPNIAVLAPLVATPFGLCVTDTAGRVFAFTDQTVVQDTTPPVVWEPFLSLMSSEGQLVGYFLFDNPSFEEVPVIPGRPPIFLQVRLMDGGTGVDERTLRVHLLDIRRGRIRDLRHDFNIRTGRWIIYVHERRYIPRGPTGRAIAAAPRLQDGEYVVILKASDYAKNPMEARFAFRVDNSLPLPTLQAAGTTGMPGAPGGAPAGRGGQVGRGLPGRTGRGGY